MLQYVLPDKESGHCLVVGSFVLLIEEGYPNERRDSFWQVMKQPEATFEDVLSGFVQHGMRELPSFVLLEFSNPEKTRALVAVRANARVHLGPDRTITAEEATSWVEAEIEMESALVLSLDEETDWQDKETLPISVGVVKTNQVLIGDVRKYKEQVEVLEERTVLSKRNTAAKQPDEWLLTLTTGQTIEVKKPVVIGRRPYLVQGQDANDTELAKLLSPQREVSARHALLAPESNGILVRDLESTNGTVVHPSSAEPILLKDGAAHILRVGETVDFGDGNVAVCKSLKN